MNKPWPAIVLAAIAIVCVTILAALRVDTTVIVSTIGVVAVPVIGALIYGATQEIKVQTNGNTSRLVELIEKQSAQLAAMTPAAVPETRTETQS